MLGRILVGFVQLNLLCSVSWQVDFFGVRVAQSLVFCMMVGRPLVGFVWPNLYFSVSWLVDFQWGSCCSIFRFLCHDWQTFSGVRVAQSLLFCVMVRRLLVGFVWLNLQSFWHGWQTFSGVRVAQSLVLCVMVGRLLVGYVWLNLYISVSCQVYLQCGSCGSIFSLSAMVGRPLVGFVCLNLNFMCHGWQTFSGVRSALSLVICVMVGRLLVGFVWLYLSCYVSSQVDFQWGSCDSIFSFLCHGWQTFSGVRMAQSLVFCVMIGRPLVGFVWLNL